MAGRPAKTFPIIDSKGNVITTVTGWNHGTVADGCELTDMTIDPICSALNNSNGEISAINDKLNAEIERAKKAEQEISAVVSSHYDEYTTFVNGEYYPFKESVLLSADALSSKLAQEIQDRIEDVSAEKNRAEGEERNLQKQIDVIKGATDVINVFASKSDFDTWSATNPPYVTDKDFVKVLVDETVSGGAQSYYQSTVNGTTTSWAFSTAMPAYYSQADFNEWSAARFTETSAKYALLAADSQKLGNTAASNIINSALSGANASAWLLANAKNYITTAEYSPYSPSYIDCTLSVAQIPNTSASKLTVKIKPIDSFVGSAESGKSAYDWITTKSATLSAGQYIKFTSAAQNTMGITVTGILPYNNGNCIAVDNSENKINLSAIVSANKYIAKELNDTSNQLSITKNKIELSGYTNNSVSYSATYSTSAVHLFARAYPPGGSQGVDITNDSVSLTSSPHAGQPTITTASWFDILNNSYKNFVIASANQTIQVATAATIPEPSEMQTGWIYLV